MSDDGLSRILVPLACAPLYSIDHSIPFLLNIGLSTIGFIASIIMFYLTRDIKVLQRQA